jgi:hypothetical protein
MTTSPLSVPHFARSSSRFAVWGIVSLLLGAVIALSDLDALFRAYLVVFLFWTGLSVGSLAVLMLQHLTGGLWALVIRRILEAATRTLPLMAVAVLPLLAGLQRLYPWARPGQTDAAIAAKFAYLNPPFFVIRTVFYFACWLVLAYLLNRWSRQEDQEASPALCSRMESLSGAGLVLFGFTLNFAAVDWVMSLEPRWYSTIYSLLLMIGMALAAMAFAVVVLIVFSKAEPLAGAIDPIHLQDLGSILLMFVMLWAYLEFSQYLIIWGENLNQEIPWYLRRLHGGWGILGLALLFLGFALPFFLLLFRHVKRRRRSLMLLAVLVLIVHFLDLCWMVLPAFGNALRLQSFVVLLLMFFGIGGLWLGYFAWQLQRMPLLPPHDPRIRDIAVAQGFEHG